LLVHVSARNRSSSIKNCKPNYKDTDVNYFRAGIWKPRLALEMLTRGVGALGLKWATKVKAKQDENL